MKKKELFAGVLIGSLLTGAAAFAVQYTATENPFPVQLNEQNIQLEGYNINDSTYFKLRDIADAVGGFSVGFENNTIKITNGDIYQQSGGDNLLDSFSADEKKKLNIFFSNFSEAFMSDFDADNVDINDMADFAYIHNFVNNRDNVFAEKIENPYYKNMCMGISEDTFDYTIQKYFGISVPHKTSVQQLSGGQYQGWIFDDGKVFRGAASGESYDIFSVVTELYDLGNGLYKAKLNTYHLPLDTMSSVYYAYDNNTALNDPDCEYWYPSDAVIKASQFNGDDVWQLVSIHKI